MILPANLPTEAINDLCEQSPHAAPTDLPLATVYKIKSITAEPTVSGETFRVSLANEIGTEFTARFWADELVSYKGFQAALLDRYGAEFDDRGRFTGNNGLGRWQSHVYDHLGRELSR